MVRRKGGSQCLGTPAIQLTRACLASCRGNLAYDFLMSVGLRPDQIIMPHRSSRGSTRSAQASFTRTRALCDKSATGSSFLPTRHPIRVSTLNIIPVLYKPAYPPLQGTGGGVQVVQDIPG